METLLNDIDTNITQIFYTYQRPRCSVVCRFLLLNFQPVVGGWFGISSFCIKMQWALECPKFEGIGKEQQTQELGSHWLQLRHLQQEVPHALVPICCIGCKYGYQVAPLSLHWLQIWPPGGSTCFGCKCGYQVAPLAVPYCLGST